MESIVVETHCRMYRKAYALASERTIWCTHGLIYISWTRDGGRMGGGGGGGGVRLKPHIEVRFK